MGTETMSADMPPDERHPPAGSGGAIEGRSRSPGEQAAAAFELSAEDFARALERGCAKARIPLPRGPLPHDHASLFAAGEQVGLTKLDLEKALHLVSLEKLPVSTRKAMGIVLQDDRAPTGRSLWLPWVVAINVIAIAVGVGAFWTYREEPLSDPPPSTAPASGAIDLDALQGALDGFSAKAQSCYQDGLGRQPSLVGRLVLVMRLDTAGGVTVLPPQLDELRDPAVLACIEAAALQHPFPAATGAAVDVEVPLAFAPIVQ
jgi:hypothetical protein